MTMKKILTVLAALMLLTVSFAAVAEGDQLDTIKARGTLTIATEGCWSPWTYHDEKDVLTGFDIEIGALIAEGLGVKADFQEVPWESRTSIPRRCSWSARTTRRSKPLRT